jgi:2-dehydro-3-deoxygluconokinase
VRIVTFGEIMLRLSPPANERLLQSPSLSATFGGAEANVAVSLARWGVDSVYVTRVPAHALGDAAVRALRAEGVRTDFILRGGDRLGIYYAESGASQRPSTVIYDRAHSAIGAIEPDAIDWRQALDGADWFHVTGVTAALGPNVATCMATALTAARAIGATVSVDLNYRRKLWSEGDAQATLRPLMRNVDLVIANEEDIQAALGMDVPGVDASAGRIDPLAYRDVAQRVSRELGPPRVAITLRESLSASDNGWRAVLWDERAPAFLQSQRYDVRIVDRIGAGDAFAAGLIYGLATGRAPEAALRFAVAAGALKHTIPGDFNRVSVDEVDRLAAGNTSGRVSR